MDISFFDRLGLTSSQRDIFLYLLEYGQFPAGSLAKRVRLNRTSTYGALNGLIKKGLVSSFMRKKVTYYEALDPEAVVNMCKARMNKEEFLLRDAIKMSEQLRHLKDSSPSTVSEASSDLEYFRGIDAVTQHIRESFEQSENCDTHDVLHYGYCNELLLDWDTIIKEKVQKGIKSRFIGPRTPAALQWASRDTADLTASRFLSAEDIPSNAAFRIHCHSISLCTIKNDEPIAVRILHPEIVGLLRSMFEYMWKKAKKA
jgi:sugar-specific transcriptional regulator TrmB